MGLDPLGQREDSQGFRFGTESESRLEYEKIPENFGTKANFSLEFRATAWDGILLYAANAPNNPKRDFFSLFFKQGKVHFNFDCGSGKSELNSEKIFTDGEFHSVVAFRDGKDAKLFVDGQLEASGSAPGTTVTIDVDPLIYVGGIPPELAKKTETHQNTMVNTS